MFLSKHVLYCLRCPFPFWQQMGGDIMYNLVTDLVVAVAAGVIVRYICKWLDVQFKAGKH